MTVIILADCENSAVKSMELKSKEEVSFVEIQERKGISPD